MTTAQPSHERRARHWFAIVCVAVGVVLLYVAAAPLLLIFAGVLFGTSLRGCAAIVSRRLHIGIHASLAITLAVLAAAAAAFVVWIAPRVGVQLALMVDALPQAYDHVRAQLADTSLGNALMGETPDLRSLAGYAVRAAGILTTAVGLAGSALFIAFVALYVAASPEQYRRGITRLVPENQRERAQGVLDALGRVLRRWLFGRLISMTAVGLATGLGMWALGIPLPAALALTAGLLGFVPNVGPIVSAVPALLLAATIDGPHVLWVLLVYLAINLGDGYVLTPAIQKRALQLPPALVLSAQIVIAALWGILGLALATPLLACIVVLIQKLYVEPTSTGEAR